LPVYLTLAGEVFVLFLLGLGIHLLASSWSRASLIHAINQADQSNRVSLKQSSLFGFKKFKTILAIDYLPWLPLLKFTIFAILISIIFAILGLAWLIMFPVIAFSVYLIIQYFKIVPAQLFAYRDSIIKDQPFEAAFTAGLSLSKGRLGIMIFTGFVNLIADFVSSLILLLVAGVASFAAIITAFTNPNPQTIAVAVITTLVSLIVAHPAILARTALLNTFKYIVWHFAYMTISPPKGDTSNEIPA